MTSLSHIPRKRKEPQGAEKHPQQPAAAEAEDVQKPPNEVQPPEGSWENRCVLFFGPWHQPQAHLDLWAYGARLDLLNNQVEIHLVLGACS